MREGGLRTLLKVEGEEEEAGEAVADVLVVEARETQDEEGDEDDVEL